MVLGKLPVPGRPTNLDKSRARTFCACSRCGWGLFGHFFSRLSFLFLSPSLWETARYRLKYCLKGPLSPKQPTNPLIQMKCQGGNKCVLSITIKFDQSTRRFDRISFAHLFELTKHITLLFHLLSPYLLSCMRGSRKNMHVIKTIMKFCAHWSTVCGMTNSDAGWIRTQ